MEGDTGGWREMYAAWVRPNLADLLGVALQLLTPAHEPQQVAHLAREMSRDIGEI